MGGTGAPSIDAQGRLLALVDPAGVRNTAMTIYRIAMVSEGYKGRPK
jgi:hypothetical protein